MEIELRNLALQMAHDLDHAPRTQGDAGLGAVVVLTDEVLHKVTEVLRKLALP